MNGAPRTAPGNSLVGLVLGRVICSVWSYVVMYESCGFDVAGMDM